MSIHFPDRTVQFSEKKRLVFADGTMLEALCFGGKVIDQTVDKGLEDGTVTLRWGSVRLGDPTLLWINTNYRKPSVERQTAPLVEVQLL